MKPPTLMHITIINKDNLCKEQYEFTMDDKLWHEIRPLNVFIKVWHEISLPSVKLDRIH